MSVPVLTAVRLADDWAALYVDDKNVHEHHEVSVQDIVDAAKGEPFILVNVGWNDGIIAWFDENYPKGQADTSSLATVLSHRDG